MSISLWFRLASFVFLVMAAVAAAPRQQVATASGPAALDLPTLLSQLGGEPSVGQLEMVRDWLIQQFEQGREQVYLAHAAAYPGLPRA